MGFWQTINLGSDPKNNGTISTWASPSSIWFSGSWRWNAFEMMRERGLLDNRGFRNDSYCYCLIHISLNWTCGRTTSCCCCWIRELKFLFDILFFLGKCLVQYYILHKGTFGGCSRQLEGGALLLLPHRYYCQQGHSLHFHVGTYSAIFPKRNFHRPLFDLR